MNKENKKSMSKPESIYMRDNVDKTIQRTESLIDLIFRRTLYNPEYYSKYNEDCSLKSSHNIEDFLQMKKAF